MDTRKDTRDMAQTQQHPQWVSAPENYLDGSKQERISEILIRYEIEAAIRSFEIEAKLLVPMD